jgi:hypothetical protein
VVAWFCGVTFPKIVHGQAPPETTTPGPGSSRLPLSSTARLLIVDCPNCVWV